MSESQTLGVPLSDKGHILVVDDDLNVCELVTLYLEREGFTVSSVHDGAEAVDVLRSHPPDLLILDLMLPGLGGMEVCREVRKTAETPIIMLTARGEDVDRILGLEFGADDYVSKPFNPRELVARVKAVLRRARFTWPKASDGKGPSGPSSASLLRFPGLVIDRRAHTASVEGEAVAFTPKEFDLLWHLASHPGRTFTREELLEAVWGFDYFGDDRTVDVHVKRLRRKVSNSARVFGFLQTVWGVGYKFQADGADAE